MPGYRGPNLLRQQQQIAAYHYPGVGSVVTWRAYVSASGGVNVAGLGATGYYRESLVSALIRPLPIMLETQTPAGMIAAGQFQMTTREAVGRNDTIVWANTNYRIEGPPVQSPLHSGWVSTIVRADV
jgi:hypothetical protein